MRSTLFVAAAALALSACNQTTPAESAASGAPSAPATIATTNAKVEPLPRSAAPSPKPSEIAMPAESPPHMDLVSAGCGAGKAARFVGMRATADVRAQVVKAVGHDLIRWIRPGDAVTMDYSDSRLNADLDEGGKITGFRCG